jgi:AdoMet-dependent rRNA methyltransferase SPB1
MDSDEVAETRAIAYKMLRKKDRENLIDQSYNRYSNMDEIEALPDWFLQDESKHYRPNIPITKEEAMDAKRELKEYNARPIKKVAEAKMRKKKKMAIQL